MATRRRALRGAAWRGLEPGESVEEAAAREAMEELGIHVRVLRSLTDETISGEVHTFVLCSHVGGTFGTGTGEEYDGSRPPERGTYQPELVELDELGTVGLIPAWAIEAVPRWLS